MNWRTASDQERSEEAERRISGARSRRARSLDLGDLGLAELPQSLASLRELEELYLGWTYPRIDGKLVPNTARPFASWQNWGPISKLTRLWLLHVGPCYDLKDDLTPIAKLTNLQSLWICLCPLAGDLSPLIKLSKLEYLKLSNCNGLTGNLSPLAKLSKLRNLEIGSCEALDGDLTHSRQALEAPDTRDFLPPCIEKRLGSTKEAFGASLARNFPLLLFKR